MLIDKLSIPGVHELMISGSQGKLELILEVPADFRAGYLAILGHPHSLQGGTMNNKVVTTMARAFRELGIASIRFNFRGVGASEGEYDAGVGESEDVLHVLRLLAQDNLQVFFAGFSFGSYVTYRALMHYHAHSAGLISIAPSVHHYDYSHSLPFDVPWLIIMGEEDELVPLNAVRQFAISHPSMPQVEYFAETGHFFHGKLLALKAILQTYILKWLPE